MDIAQVRRLAVQYAGMDGDFAPYLASGELLKDIPAK